MWLDRTQQEACGQEASPTGWRVGSGVVAAVTLKPTYNFNWDKEESPAVLGSGCAASGDWNPSLGPRPTATAQGVFSQRDIPTLYPGPLLREVPVQCHLRFNCSSG